MIINKLTLILLTGIASSCNSQELNYSMNTKYGVFMYSLVDTNSVKDFVLVAEKEIPRICSELKIDFDNSVIIEIYPNQERYNISVLNHDLINSPAISGNSRIQLISPLAPLHAESKIGPIEYADRLSFLIHEYTHILLDKLENAIPLCIDEGIASYYSSREFYLEMATKYVKQINNIPSIDQLISHYHEVPAPDLFSFLLIDFTIQQSGKKILADLIRETDKIHTLNDKWIEYIKQKYY